MRVLVCGGRDYDDGETLARTLDRLHARHGDALEIVHGAARGADLLAEEWAKQNEVPYIGVPARWRKGGKNAGPERNKRMLDRYQPKGVVAFPGGNGTANMIRQAKEAGLSVWQIGAEQNVPKA